MDFLRHSEIIFRYYIYVFKYLKIIISEWAFYVIQADKLSSCYPKVGRILNILLTRLKSVPQTLKEKSQIMWVGGSINIVFVLHGVVSLFSYPHCLSFPYFCLLPLVGHEATVSIEPIISPIILNMWALHVSDPFISIDALEILEVIMLSIIGRCDGILNYLFCQTIYRGINLCQPVAMGTI